MKFKAILIAAMALSTVLFPLSAAPWGTNIFYYYDSNGNHVGVRAARLCEISWGITTPYYDIEICP